MFNPAFPLSHADDGTRLATDAERALVDAYLQLCASPVTHSAPDKVLDGFLAAGSRTAPVALAK